MLELVASVEVEAIFLWKFPNFPFDPGDTNFPIDRSDPTTCGPVVNFQMISKNGFPISILPKILDETKTGEHSCRHTKIPGRIKQVKKTTGTDSQKRTINDSCGIKFHRMTNRKTIVAVLVFM